jgi:nicotinamidase-related amidase
MTDNLLSIDSKTSALVLIDLQKGIVGREVAPHSAEKVLGNAVRLADAFRHAGATVVLVRVSSSPDGADRVRRAVDLQWPTGAPPPGWDEIAPDLGPKSGDILVTKRQWGAFYGTDLDLHLRRRGIVTIVLGGIATSIGVESTARDAFEHNYGLVLVEDAMADMSAEAHEFAVKSIYPRISRVRSTEQVIEAIR